MLCYGRLIAAADGHVRMHTMKEWVDRFFQRNKTIEVELTDMGIDQLVRRLRSLGWSHADDFWSPDLQVGRFTRDKDELFVLQETYFGPKVTGHSDHIAEIQKSEHAGAQDGESAAASSPPVT